MPESSTLESRINAILDSLNSAYAGGGQMSSASKGAEREIFVKNVLQQVFPPHFRFSSGDIVDSNGNQSGQVDIVLEQPRGYSFPLASVGPRLFLAENVAAVIEVKSNLCNQWDEVVATAEKLAQVRPVFANQNFADMLDRFDKGEVEFDPSMTDEDISKARKLLVDQSNHPSNIGRKRIPLIVVGFEGWTKESTLIEKLVPDRIDGILIISRKVYADIARAEGHRTVTGPSSLLALLHQLEEAFQSMANRFAAYTQYLR